MNLASIRAAFPDRLPDLSAFGACALVDYPLHPNPGDHMLFLSALLWLSRQCDPARMYLAHRLNFSKVELNRKIGENPIFCLGGGNLGDLWPNPQRFREKVVQACPTQPIVLLPQCLHFGHLENLERAQAIFNAHPHLTIMVRDPVSLGLARQHFKAAIIHTPDQAVVLADVIPPRAQAPDKRAYFLTRGQDDREASPDLPAFHRVTAAIPSGNWDSMGLAGSLSGIGVYLNPRTAPSVGALDDMPPALREVTRQVDRPAYVFRSWRIVQQSIRQLDPYHLVITDRFHGHILCAIRHIPHVVVGNNHHKIQAHWEQWMRGLPGATFARSPEDLTAALATVAAVPATPTSK